MKLSLRPCSYLLITGFVLFFLLFSPHAGLSRNEQIIMVTEAWPPFRINDKNSPSGFSGIDIDITNKLSEAIGITIDIQRHPWARALELMRSGQADMVTGIAYTAERETYLHYVPISYYAVRPVFYTQKGKGRLIRSYQDLYGPSVGYSLNSAYFEPFNSDDRINKVGLSTEVQLLQVLALGRIDITIGTDPMAAVGQNRPVFCAVAKIGGDGACHAYRKSPWPTGGKRHRGYHHQCLQVVPCQLKRAACSTRFSFSISFFQCSL